MSNVRLSSLQVEVLGVVAEFCRQFKIPMATIEIMDQEPTTKIFPVVVKTAKGRSSGIPIAISISGGVAYSSGVRTTLQRPHACPGGCVQEAGGEGDRVIALGSSAKLPVRHPLQF